MKLWDTMRTPVHPFRLRIVLTFVAIHSQISCTSMHVSAYKMSHTHDMDWIVTQKHSLCLFIADSVIVGGKCSFIWRYSYGYVPLMHYGAWVHTPWGRGANALLLTKKVRMQAVWRLVCDVPYGISRSIP
eukprot:6209058-Pleurochrysis_carterae.AAC.3